MFSPFSKHNAVFGLDIGFETLKLVELKTTKSGAKLVGCSNFPLPERILEKDHFKDKAAAAKIIKEACVKAKPNPIVAKKIVSALPETFVFTKTIQMPRMTDEEYEKALPAEAAQYLPLPIEEVYIDYQVMTTNPDKPNQDLLFVATPKRLVDEYVELAKIAGCELVGLEPKAISVGRALTYTGRINPTIGLVVVEIGTEITRISIWDTGSIRLTTTVGIGKNQLGTVNETTGERILNSDQTNLSTIIYEAVEVIKYHQNRDYEPHPIEKILLCGSGAKYPGVDTAFNEKTSLSVEVVEPTLLNDHRIGTEYINAFGLALRKDFS